MTPAENVRLREFLAQFAVDHCTDKPAFQACWDGIRDLYTLEGLRREDASQQTAQLIYKKIFKV